MLPSHGALYNAIASKLYPHLSLSSSAEFNLHQYLIKFYNHTNSCNLLTKK